MAGRDGIDGPRGGLGMGLMGLLQAKTGVPFRPVVEGGSGETMGMEATSSSSSLAALIRRPAAPPDRTRFSGPDQETRRGKQPLREGHEGSRQRIEGRELKRPKSFAELRNKGANLSSFGKLGRITVVEGTGVVPPSAPEVHREPEEEEGISPWKDLEFEAGMKVEKPEPPGGEHYTLASMYQIANDAAARAKQTLAAAVEFWSPKRTKHQDPALPEGWLDKAAPKQNERCPQSARTQTKGLNHKGKKVKAANILAIARRAANSRAASKALEEGFASVTSVKSKKAIRNTVVKVFQEARQASGLPPTPERVKLLGGVLKAAGYRAAGNYLGEYKLMAVEAGHEWTSQLERTLKLCKRSAVRAIGPKQKAAEVETSENGEHFATKAFDKNPKNVPLAAELFEFGVIWMLREIELAAITRDHIVLNFQDKKVTFTLPVSKGDQEAVEVKRVLQCLCDQNVCRMSCPFYTAVRLIDRMVALGLNRACTNRKKKAASKAQLVEDWRILYGTKVSGHSARRTGALRYIRRGWAIPQVAYLGRWKSAVIYEYAAEALESLPVNVGDTFGPMRETQERTCNPTIGDHTSKEELENVKNYLLAELERAKADQESALSALDAEVEDLRKRDLRLGNRLPPIVQSVASKVVHYNMDIASCSPPRAWRTMCGWYYHRSDFVFITRVDGLHMCKKCWDLAQSNREKVSEAKAAAAGLPKVASI